MTLTNKERRENRKKQLIELLGNKCKHCGYNRSLSALVFHHIDEKQKAFNISGNNLTSKSWDKLKKEIGKCILLCHNCHTELHDKEGWVHENGKKTPK